MGWVLYCKGRIAKSKCSASTFWLTEAMSRYGRKPATSRQSPLSIRTILIEIPGNGLTSELMQSVMSYCRTGDILCSCVTRTAACSFIVFKLHLCRAEIPHHTCRIYEKNFQFPQRSVSRRNYLMGIQFS
jgi:hypothetical protein